MVRASATSTTLPITGAATTCDHVQVCTSSTLHLNHGHTLFVSETMDVNA